MTKRETDKRQDALLGDLENIRALLDEEQQALEHQASTDNDVEATPETNVPLLEDVIAGGIAVEEQFLTGAVTLETESEEFPGLDEEMIEALMGDEWRAATRKIFNEARQKIDDHEGTWTPDATDELNDALKVRIDATVERWLHQLVADNIDALRQQLVGALGKELTHLLEDFDEGDRGR